MHPVKIQCGALLIEDAMNPKQTEIDIQGIESRMMTIKRFGGHPRALNVMQHSKLVERMATVEDAHAMLPHEMADAIIRWAKHHDYHEGITGDIIGPMKTLIGQETDIIRRLEETLDRAICEKLGFLYPGPRVHQIVHVIDKAAETLEWVFAMGQELASWNHPVHPVHWKEGAELIRWAQMQ